MVNEKGAAGDGDWPSKIAVVIPCYKVKQFLEKIVNKLLDIGVGNIICVVDACPDGTGELAEHLASNNDFHFV